MLERRLSDESIGPERKILGGVLLFLCGVFILAFYFQVFLGIVKNDFVYWERVLSIAWVFLLAAVLFVLGRAIRKGDWSGILGKSIVFVSFLFLLRLISWEKSKSLVKRLFGTDVPYSSLREMLVVGIVFFFCLGFYWIASGALKKRKKSLIWLHVCAVVVLVAIILGGMVFNYRNLHQFYLIQGIQWTLRIEGSADMQQTMDTIRRRIGACGIDNEDDLDIRLKRGNRIVLNLPASAASARVKRSLEKILLVELRLAEAGPAQSREELLKDFQGRVPADMEVLTKSPDWPDPQVYYLVYKKAAISGRDFSKGSHLTNEYSMPSISFTLTAEGARKMEKITTEKMGHRMIIMLDGKVMADPVIRDVIYSNGVISGRISGEDGEDILVALNSGPLLASSRIVKEKKMRIPWPKDREDPNLERRRRF